MSAPGTNRHTAHSGRLAPLRPDHSADGVVTRVSAAVALLPAHSSDGRRSGRPRAVPGPPSPQWPAAFAVGTVVCGPNGVPGGRGPRIRPARRTSLPDHPAVAAKQRRSPCPPRHSRIATWRRSAGASRTGFHGGHQAEDCSPWTIEELASDVVALFTEAVCSRAASPRSRWAARDGPDGASLDVHTGRLVLTATITGRPMRTLQPQELQP